MNTLLIPPITIIPAQVKFGLLGFEDLALHQSLVRYGQWDSQIAHNIINIFH